MSASTDDVVSAFEDLGIDLEPGRTVDLLASLCDIYGLDVDAMSTEVMAYMYKLKMGASATPTLKVLESFEAEVLKRRGDKRRADAARGIVDVTNLLAHHDAGGGDDEDDDDGILSAYGAKGATPKGDKKRANKMTPEDARKKLLATDGGGVPFSPASYKPDGKGDTPNSRKYQSRPNPGSTVIRFGDMTSGAGAWKTPDSQAFEAEVRFSESSLRRPYRYMFETLQSKAGRLDENICRLGEELAAKDESLEDPVDFGRPCPDPFTCLGRVCCDNPDGRLNVHSVVLQGTQDICDGRCVALEPSRVGEFSLFPGQVVRIVATNPSGSRLSATRIFSDASPALPSKQDRVSSEAAGGRPMLSVVAASGPYTTSDNLGYEPLRDLLRYLLAHKPHLAILAGPFVDSRHESTSPDEDEEAFEDTFKRVAAMVGEAAREIPSTKVVLVSSARDLHHADVYPTPPYSTEDLKDLQLPPNVVMASDPSVFTVEGVQFGVTSTDVLFHLGKEEISAPPRSGDRLRRLANHVLQQRSFYPLYPPNEEMNVDFEKLEAHAQINQQPHVLILPSDFLHFFKDVNGGLVLNPSRLARKEAGGCFARFQIRPQAKDGEKQKFSQRVLGEIVRI